MNLPFDAGSSSKPLFLHIRFNDFQVSWAGPHPFRPGFCFGSEDGQLLFTDENGGDVYGGPTKGSISGEAINGVASWQNWLAISTRAEVNFVAITGIDSRQTFPGGAHGVIATPSGHFVAPLGRNGLMSLKPENSGKLTITISSGTEEEYSNLYRVICLPSGGREVLACAMRRGGIGVTELGGDDTKHSMNTITFDGLDVVDVCAIGQDNDSLAVAALGKNGTLVLFRDVVNDKSPITMKYDHIKGTAYRLLSCRGHLFMLTSKGLHFFARLAERFLAGQSIGDTNTPVLFMPMEAVDANLYLDRWLLVVIVDEARRFDVGMLHDNIPDPASLQKPLKGRVANVEPAWEEQPPRRMNPDWKRRGFKQRSNAALAGVS
jgi:hypothetical protein